MMTPLPATVGIALSRVLPTRARHKKTRKNTFGGGVDFEYEYRLYLV
jgi:hypothetical protein